MFGFSWFCCSRRCTAARSARAPCCRGSAGRAHGRADADVVVTTDVQLRGHGLPPAIDQRNGRRATGGVQIAMRAWNSATLSPIVGLLASSANTSTSIVRGTAGLSRARRWSVRQGHR